MIEHNSADENFYGNDLTVKDNRNLERKKENIEKVAIDQKKKKKKEINKKRKKEKKKKKKK